MPRTKKSRGKNPRLCSLFAGCGGLDLGFRNAGFDIPWANEFDKSIWQTYQENHPATLLDRRSITEVQPSEIPDCEGILGGPPCQSWSESGAHRGIEDQRGQLFFEYIRLLEAKKPRFFLAENVPGMLAPRHGTALKGILAMMSKVGYYVSFKKLNAWEYGVPQNRQRIFFVGYRKDLGIKFKFPSPCGNHPTLRDAIWDLRGRARPALDKNHHNPRAKNQNEYMIGSFSTMYMSRNRVRSWDEPSFTIQAGGRHAPIHPKASKMVKVGTDAFVFNPKSRGAYRRLSVRECARVQGFPDSFQFRYNLVANGYKMIGNAVPVQLAEALARVIRKDLS